MIESDTDTQTVNKIIDQLGELPVAPVILHKALRLTSDLQSSIDDISRNISADQILASKVIRMSNSPAYGRLKEVSSLQEAITILGFSQVKSIIITASTLQIFQSGTQAGIAKILWQHSLATALAARLIVQKFGGLDKEEAYLCGLLHDIGKLVLLQTAPYAYEDVIEKVKTNLTFIKVEGNEFGFNHVNVGHVLLSKWRFPSNLISQISTHHSTKPDQIAPSMSIGRVIAIANTIAKYNGAGFFEAYKPQENNVLYIGEKLISEDDLISLRLDTEEYFNYEMNSFSE